jgi:maltodextrin utilization protein YvdJ
MQNLGCLAAFSSAGFLAVNQQYALPSLAAAAISLVMLGLYKPLSYLAHRQDSPTSPTRLH